jgi:hypothetical protein
MSVFGGVLYLGVDEIKQVYYMSIFGGVLYLGVDEIKQVYVYIWRGALFRSRRDKAGICLYLEGCSI